MTDLRSLPDYPALEQLARALWRNGTVRGAAVLVGAGFSRNAIRPGADTPKPPLWGQLLEALILQLYPSTPELAPKSPLRIAEEYRTFFGQAALDDFIRTHFPDRAWLPGQLHDALLELPWSDVLTTNWDTLLERASNNARDQRYDVVKYEADLPHARAPRIAKLHGTLGDTGPLIFAEEDYRTYPTRHAAFVNLARQIFIENELCLIGFSGDDPNFLQWAGWVRDQLGGNARRIYLVGNLDLPRATRKFLEAHNIAPIDFAPTVQNLPKGDEQHAAASQKFFDALIAARPAPADEWNRVSSRDYPMRKDAINAHERVRKDVVLAAKFLGETSDILAQDREKYPGWLVCPRQERRFLQDHDEAWLQRPTTLAQFTPERQVEILFEIVWRRVIGLYPLDENLVTAIGTLAEDWPTGAASEKRQYFLIALMRDSRIDDKGDDFAKWSALFSKYAPDTSPQKLDAVYEMCLRARDRLDYTDLSNLTAQITSDDPVWLMRRAGLLAELGEFTKATRLIKDASSTLEQAYRLDRDSLWIKARLGWADWLADLTDLAHRHSPRHTPREFKSLKIDPENEISYFRDEAMRIASKRLAEEARQPIFEAGHYRDGSRSTRIMGGDESLLLAFTLEQLIETVGLPMRINNVEVCSNTVVETASASHQQSVTWHTRLLRALHSHSDRAFNRFFSRLALAQLPADSATELVAIVEQSVRFWLQRLKASQHPDLRDDEWNAVNRLRLMLYAYSHLTVRMTPEKAEQAFLLALEIARDPAIRHNWLLEALGHLATRATVAIPPRRHGALSFAVMEFPLAVEKDTQEHFWPRIVTAIWEAPPERPDSDPKWLTRVAELIAAAWKGNTSREEAVLRLDYLHRHNALTESEISAFGSALWSDVSEGEFALPANTNLLTSTFYGLPAPAGINVQERVRHDLIDVDLEAALLRGKMTDSRAASDIQNYLISLHNTGPLGISIESGRAATLFDQLVKWRPAPADRRDPFSTSFTRSANEGLRTNIGDALSVAIVPAMDSTDRNESRLRALLEFINAVASWRGLPGLVHFLPSVPNMREDVSAAIRRGMVGSNHQHVSAAAYALSRWAHFANKDSNVGLPRSLVARLVATIENRPEHGLSTLLNAMAALLKLGYYDSSDLPQLLQALGDLRVETSYANIGIDDEEAISASLVRRECVGLALALKPLVVDDGTLAGWIEDARNDPLPEVRFRLEATS